MLEERMEGGNMSAKGGISARGYSLNLLVIAAEIAKVEGRTM